MSVHATECCLACGRLIQPQLAAVGSSRCQDCSDLNRKHNAQLVLLAALEREQSTVDPDGAGAR
jgi:hypothetical protein